MRATILAMAVSATVAMAPASAAVSILGDYTLSEWTVAGKAQSLDAKRDITLSLSKGGEVTGFAGCNRYVGFVQAEPLDFGKLASTRKMCADAQTMQRETQYLAALSAIKDMKQVRENGKSFLRLSGEGDTYLTFEMVEKPAEKTIWVGSKRKPCSAGAGKAMCLQVKYSEAGVWQYFYGHIEGFQWVEGKSYQLRIREEKIKNPPADASNLRTTLIEVVSER